MPKSKKKNQSVKQQSNSKKTTLTLKEKFAQKRQIARQRKEFTNLLTTAIFGGLFLGFILFFVGGIKAAVSALLGTIIMSFSYKYPRLALYTFIIYIPFAGTITYYIGSSPVLQLAKDSFYIPALIGIWQTCRQKRLPVILPTGIKTPLFIFLGLCMLTFLFANGMQQLNPKSAELFQKAPQELPIGMGILGLKVLLGYFPVITCIYYLIRNQKDFLSLSRLQVSLILICCTLGLIQYLLLLTGICQGTREATGDALFKATVKARCYFGGALLYSPSQGVIRLPGTFVAPWQWAWFLISSTFFAFATGFGDPKIKWRTVGLVSMALIFVNAAISGQRIALALVPFCFLLLLIITGKIGDLKRFIPIGIGLAIILGIAIVNYPEIVQERIDSLFGRWEASPPHEFIIQQFEDTWKEQRGFFGRGLGRATNSARALGKTRLIETYYPKLLYEIGVLGTLGFLALVTTLTVICYGQYRRIKNRNFRSYAAAMWTFILFISYNTYYYPLDVDPVAVYYWFSAGILLKLPVIDKQEKILENSQGTKRKNTKIPKSISS
ncbi:hormogonium polysaccharide biosynthesis protein HpsL [Calothrix rhizosoleniae]|uniref:hormogonium polysaccharide biosynthesis protein HpsL n=1 Tax=Calothrix rhizosoleniae TaxID=888997 RepID=UPI000B49C27A|nr:hormogonium polysaccharide biosynthesis protein HpsL [Calothrix rhizosoleniae]